MLGMLFSQLAACVSPDLLSRVLKEIIFGSYTLFIFGSWPDLNTRISSVSSIHLCGNEPGFRKSVLSEQIILFPAKTLTLMGMKAVDSGSHRNIRAS